MFLKNIFLEKENNSIVKKLEKKKMEKNLLYCLNSPILLEKVFWKYSKKFKMIDLKNMKQKIKKKKNNYSLNIIVKTKMKFIKIS